MSQTQRGREMKLKLTLIMAIAILATFSFGSSDAEAGKRRRANRCCRPVAHCACRKPRRRVQCPPPCCAPAPRSAPAPKSYTPTAQELHFEIERLKKALKDEKIPIPDNPYIP